MVMVRRKTALACMLALGVVLAWLVSSWGAAEFSDETASLLPAIEDDTRKAAFADFDSDGDQDLFVVNTGLEDEGVDRLLIYQGGAFVDLTLERLPEELSSRYGSSCLVWDVEPDGDQDILIANMFNGRMRLLLNSNVSPGYFVLDDPEAPGARLPELRGYQDVCALDLEPDGDQDLILVPASGRARVMMNVGDGYFADTTDASIPFSWGGGNTSALSGDWDGDELEDLFLPTAGGQARLLLNDSGVFWDATATHLPDSMPAARATAADVDRDGDLDLILADDGDMACRLFINDGQGVFTDETGDRLPSVGPASVDVLATDMDADGDTDIILSDLGDGVQGVAPTYLDNDGTGHFTDGSDWVDLFEASGYCIAAVDVTGDQLPDLFAGCGGFGPPGSPSRQNRILVNQGQDALDPYGRPARLSLGRPFPNPFTEEVSVRLSVSEGVPYSLRILNLRGRAMGDAATGTGVGVPMVEGIGGTNLTPGAYLIQLESGGARASTRVIKLD
jgi:hypothetical protein